MSRKAKRNLFVGILTASILAIIIFFTVSSQVFANPATGSGSNNDGSTVGVTAETDANCSSGTSSSTCGGQQSGIMFCKLDNISACQCP